MKIAHLSDVHFGRISHPGIVKQLVGEVNEEGVDLVAVSGDLTMRARTGQFRHAAEMIKGFHAPTIVVPGNHDVYPWWRPFSRMTRPLGRYRKLITDDLSPTYRKDDLAVLGVNSAFGRTVKGGRLDSKQRESITGFFGPLDNALFKVLVVHHHLTRIQALGDHDVVHKARRALEIASSAGVDLILCGHLHVSHVEPVEVVPAGYRIVIVSAGTATSSRGRGKDAETNFYNYIHVHPDHFVVDVRRYDTEKKTFTAFNSQRFDRNG